MKKKKKIITKSEWLGYIEALKAWVELVYPTGAVALDDSGSQPPVPPPPPPGSH